MHVNSPSPISTAAQAADLPDPQRLALTALLRGVSQTEAAQEAGVGNRTLRRWLHDPVFLTALRHARSEHWTEVTSRLQQASSTAVDTLLAVMADESHPLARVRAAQAVLNLAAKALDLDALHARAVQIETDLEAHLQQLSGRESPPAPGTDNDDNHGPNGGQNNGSYGPHAQPGTNGSHAAPAPDRAPTAPRARLADEVCSRVNRPQQIPARPATEPVRPLPPALRRTRPEAPVSALSPAAPEAPVPALSPLSIRGWRGVAEGRGEAIRRVAHERLSRMAVGLSTPPPASA